MAVEEPVVVEVNTTEDLLVVNEESPLVIVQEEASTQTLEVLVGQQGVPGPANVLSVGTVGKTAAGGNPSVSITGTAPNQTINFTLPTGDTGPANTLAIGTVSTLAPGSTATASITGTAPNQTLSLGIPAGAKILQGTGAPAGGTGVIGDWYINTTTWDMSEKTGASTWTVRLNIRGATGPANTLAIGTVSKTAAGGTPTASITGTAPNQTLNLTLPTGDTGPANSLSVGTVAKSAAGGNPAVTITGTAPSQTINFTLPTGDTGPANTLAIGTVTKSAAGGSAAATITGTAPNQTLNLTLPTGDTGPAPNLTIGTVTTGAAGSNAAVTIGGTNPNYSLNFTLPTGKTIQWLSGSGAPGGALGAVDDWYVVNQGTTGLGDVYKKTGASTWTLQGNIRGAAGNGSVNAVNNVNPDVNGNVTFRADDLLRSGYSLGSGASGANQWTRVATVSLAEAYWQANLKILVLDGNNNATSMPYAEVYWQVANASTLAGAPAAHLTVAGTKGMTTSHFKSVVTSNTGTGPNTIELWVQSPNTYITFSFFEIGRAVQGIPTITYSQGGAWQASLPAGTQVNAVDESIRLSAIPTGTTSSTVALGNHSHALTDSNITGILPDGKMPDRLRGTPPANLTDANLAVDSGWYSVTNTATNLPIAWWGTIQVQRRAGGTEAVQLYRRANTDEVSNGATYRRWRSGDGTWTAWTRTYETAAELDTAYVSLTGAQTISGSKTFSQPQYFHSPTGGPLVSVKMVGPTYSNANGAIVVDTDNTNGTQTVAFQARVAGTNTFSVRSDGTVTASGTISAAAPTAGGHLTTKTYVDGLDGANVKTSGDQTISGAKTFSSTNGIVVNAGAGYSTQLTHNDLYFTRAGVSYVTQSGAGGSLALRGTTTTVADTAWVTYTNSIITHHRDTQFSLGLRVLGSAATPVAGVFSGAGNTQQSYIHFPAVSNSNDPGYIMHESSGAAGYQNYGVIHISPSDDNAFGDYVAIHGTNDPETIKIHTTGEIETPARITAARILATETTSHSGFNGRLRAGFNSQAIGATPLTTSAAEFELSVQSMVTIGETTAGNGNPSITMYRTASGTRSGRALRMSMDGSAGPLRWQVGSDAAYGSETYTNLMSLDWTGQLSVTGTVIAAEPTASSHLTTKSYVDNSIAALADSAPETLNTLNELAAALGDDPNFATTVTNSIATKQPLLAMGNVASGTDLNTITTTGLYTLSDGQGAGAYVNYPTGAYGWGTFEVLVTDNGTITQNYYPHTNASHEGMYTRTKWYGGSFTPWKAMATKAQADSKQDTIPTGTTSQYYRGDKTWQTLNSTAVGLASVPNYAGDKMRQEAAGSGLTAGWVRIATQTSGKGVATFTVWDDTSNVHNFVRFNVSISYNEDPQITILNSGSYSVLSITGIRIVQDKITTPNSFSNPVILEVQIANTTAITVAMTDNNGQAPWVLATPANVALGANHTTFTTVTLDGTQQMGTTGKGFFHNDLTVGGKGNFAGIVSNLGGGNLVLKPGGGDHTYMAFHARTASPDTRSGYLGYASAGSNDLRMQNEISGGGITLSTVGNGNVNINAGTGTVAVTGALTVSAASTMTGGIDIPGSTDLRFSAAGVNPPTFTTRSAGTKVLLYPALSASAVDYAIGVENSTIWQSIPQNSSSMYFRWYGGTTNVMSLGGTGHLTINGNFNAAGSLTGQHLVLSSGGNSAIEIGRTDGTASTPHMDFHSGATTTDYDVRLIASGGTGSNAGGNLNIQAAGLQWNGTSLITTNDARLSDARTPTAHTHTLDNLPDAWVKRAVRVASTANLAIPPGGTALTVDGVTLANGDRILLKNQTTTAQNGIYVVGGIGSSVTLTRAADADAASEIAGATVSIDQGTQGGQIWTTTFKTTDTVGTTAMTWYKMIDSSTGVETSGNQTIGGTKTFTSEIVGPATGNVLKVGDDARLVDINLQHIMGIVSQTDGTNQGGILFGTNAGNFRLHGNGATATATGNLIVTGTAEITNPLTVRPINYAANQALDGVRVGTRVSGGQYFWETRFGLASGAGGNPRAGIRWIVRDSAGAVTSDVEPVSILPGGNVGIGVEAPTVKLQVSGDITGGVVTSTGFSGPGANITGVVHTSNAETVGGIKTFTDGILLSTSTTKVTGNVAGVAFTPDFQNNGATSGSSSYLQSRFTNDVNGSHMVFAKSRGATLGTHAVLANNDAIAHFTFNGSDGAGFFEAGKIEAFVNGTPATGSVPGGLRFLTTAAGAGTATTALTLASNNEATFAGRVIAATGFAATGYPNTNYSFGASGGSLYIEGNAGGNIYLRPNGTGSNTGLVTIGTAGTTVAGTLNSTGTLSQNGTAVSLSGHTHDDRYYTESESDARFINQIEVGTTNFRRARGLVRWEQAVSNGTGDLVIQTNMTFTNVMARLHIHGYNYLGGSENIDLKVGYYAYNSAGTPQFVNTGAQDDGSFPVSQVRLMRRTSDNKVAIVISSGATGNYWQYPKIAVDGIFGHTAIADADLQGWSASLVTDLAAYTAMTTVSMTRDARVNAANTGYIHASDTFRVGAAGGTNGATGFMKWANSELTLDTWTSSAPVRIGGSEVKIQTEGGTWRGLTAYTLGANRSNGNQLYPDIVGNGTGLVLAQNMTSNATPASYINLTASRVYSYSSAGLGGTAGNYTISRQHTHYGSSNNFHHIHMMHRSAAGADWTTSELIDGIGVDVSFMEPASIRTWWKRNPNTQVQTWGSNSSTPQMTLSGGNLTVTGTITSGNTAVSLSGHTHDDRYYTETEADGRYLIGGTTVTKTGMTEVRRDLATTARAYTDATFSVSNGTGHSTLGFHNAGANAASLQYNRSTTQFEFMNQTGSGYANVRGLLSASDLSTGTVPVDRLGSSGTRDGTTFLAGDNTWKTVSTSANVTRVVYTTTVPARPAGATYVEWVGQVDPGSNALAGDTWVPTA